MTSEMSWRSSPRTRRDGSTATPFMSTAARCCELSQIDHPTPRRVRDRVGAAGGVELVEDRADMEFGGMDRYAEPLRDGLVGGALGHQREDVALARRQIGLGRLCGTMPIACHERHVRRLGRTRKAQAGDAAEQRRQPVREFGIVDLDRNEDGRGGFLAHVSGLSAIVTLNRAGSPPLFTATATTEPTLSGPSACNIARTLERVLSFQPTMTSPCRMPALADGPVLSTLITIAPTPSSSLTGCRLRPR